jgi:hypothetical protein
MEVEEDKLVWIPCIIIKEDESNPKLKLVQPIDGWEEHRLWSSNTHKFPLPEDMKSDETTGTVD